MRYTPSKTYAAVVKQFVAEGHDDYDVAVALAEISEGTLLEDSVFSALEINVVRDRLDVRQRAA